MKAFLLSATKKFGYVLASCIIIVAFLVSATRLLTPLFNQHRNELERWASQVLQIPVSIQNAELSWSVYQPVVSLNQVSLTDKDTHIPILQIKKIKIFLSVLQSLWQRKAVPSVIAIENTNLNITESKRGDINLKGLPTLYSPVIQDAEDQNADLLQNETKKILQEIFSQPRLLLRNIDIHFARDDGQKYYVTLHNLTIQNKGAKHLILGKATLHQKQVTEATVAIDWEGKEIDLTKVNANVYVYVSGVSIPQWFKKDSYRGWEVQQGMISAKVWGEWHQGVFNRIQTQFELYGVNLYSAVDKKIHRVQRFSGNVGWQRSGNQYIFAGNDILIDLPNHLWPVTDFYFSVEKNQQEKFEPRIAKMNYLDLADTKSFLLASSDLFSPRQLKTLSKLQIEGQLQNVNVVFSGPVTDIRNIVLSTQFNRVGIEQKKKLPTIKHISGSIKWDGKVSKGAIGLNSHQVSFNEDSLFANPIFLDQLYGNTQLSLDQNGAWTIRIDALNLLNKDLAANVTGTLTVPTDGNVAADLNAHFTMQQVKYITSYLPLHYFSRDLSDWLRQAFLSGEIVSADAILRGPLKQFPFDDSSNIFSVSGNVKNIDFNFAPGWPVIKNIEGKLVFNQRALKIAADHASIFDIPLTHVQAEIPDLLANDPMVQVNGNNIETDFAHALKFIRQSALNDVIGQMFTGMELQGPIRLQLGLSLPINDPSKIKVNGEINFPDAAMQLPSFNLTVEHLKGLVAFTEDGVTANGIEAQLFNQLLKLNLATIKAGAVSTIVAKFSTHLDISTLENWLKIPFSKVVSGSADVTSEIEFERTANSPIGIHLQSDLRGVAVKLPDEFAKNEEQKREFSADILTQAEQPIKVRLNYGNLLSTALILEQRAQDFKLTGANLRLGQGSADWPAKPGLYITGSFDKLNWEKIKSYAAQSGSAEVSDLKLQEINVYTKTLELFGKKIPDVRLAVTTNADKWKINMSSPTISGTISAPVNFNRDGIVIAQFDKFKMPSKSSGSSLNSNFNLKTLPALDIALKNVQLDGTSIGKIIFKAIPSDTGMDIEVFKISSPRMDIAASGEWLQTGDNQSTSLHGTMRSSNVSNLVNSFGLNAKNFVSSNGAINFDLRWQGPPFLPETASLNGRASLQMGRGRIVDIGQASETKMDFARMLSIFSLQTIPRRLSLDFSDVFQKGYSFDSIGGHFVFRNGNAYTENLEINGPVAKVNIAGRIGLKNKDYDFTLSVTPYVSGTTIPVAATLLSVATPVVGLAAVAASTVIAPQLSKAITYYYNVSGPWSNPSWTSVSVPTRS